MKGDLALDTVVNWLILLVVAGVVIGIIFTYSDKINEILFSNQVQPTPETQYIEAQSFPESQIKTLVDLCWSKTGEDYYKDFVCYILKGNLNSINASNIQGVFEGYVVITDFNNSRDMLTIRFEDVGNKIIVQN